MQEDFDLGARGGRDKAGMAGWWGRQKDVGPGSRRGRRKSGMKGRWGGQKEVELCVLVSGPP